MDEMEIAISFKAIRLAWFYTVIFLFVWITYDFIKEGNFNENPAFFLLISQNIILILSQIYWKKKMENEK